jgi:hypothetical protein
MECIFFAVFPVYCKDSTSLTEDSQSVTCEKLACTPERFKAFWIFVKNHSVYPVLTAKKECWQTIQRSLGTMLKIKEIVMRNSTFSANEIKKDITDVLIHVCFEKIE